MTQLQRLFLTLGIIFASLCLGWITRVLSERKKMPFSNVFLNDLRCRLQNIAIFFLLPLAAALSIWGLPQPKMELLALPFLGLAAYVWGGASSVFIAKKINFNRIQTGSFFCCGTFTNIGAVGGLVCLLFLGENSIALVALYRLFEEMYYFSIAFPVAQWFGSQKSGNLDLKSFKPSPALVMILCALLFGVFLNFTKTPRPDLCSPIASGSMIAATIFFLFSIGLTLHLSKLKGDFVPGLIMTGLKFFVIPSLIVPLAFLSGLNSVEGGLPLKTAAILSAMPVAMTALIPPSLFNLDVDLANACWIYSTLGLIFWLPFLLFIIAKI